VTFEVSKRPTRRFIVKARDVEVRVVGTKFVVDHGEQVSVTVLEGIVEVRAGDEVKRLTRGAVWIASPRSLPGGALNGGALNGGALGGALGGGALGGGALGGGALGGGALGGGALGGGALGGGALGGALGGDALDATGGGAALGAPLADATGSGGARGDDARAGVARGGDTRGDGLRAVGARGGGTRVGDARAGDARVGDARVGDARVGDARGGDARVDDARLPSPRPSPQGEREVAAPDPASDFAAAMRARSAGHVTEAIRGFQQVCERFPSSAYAPMSAFEWGRLALDSQDDPRQAARAFERTLELATSASLIEDALARLTEAYARYDVGSCRRVQAEYLRRFPGGPHVRGVTKACP
jgi:TolA-binding protein